MFLDDPDGWFVEAVLRASSRNELEVRSLASAGYVWLTDASLGPYRALSILRASTTRDELDRLEAYKPKCVIETRAYRADDITPRFVGAMITPMPFEPAELIEGDRPNLHECGVSSAAFADRVKVESITVDLARFEPGMTVVFHGDERLALTSSRWLLAIRSAPSDRFRF